MVLIMKKILQTLKNKWAEYLLETMVIVIGILGAYMLDNWNDKRKERILEKDMLMELRINLDRDLADLEMNLVAHREALKSQTILLDWIDGKQQFADTLCRHFRQAGSTTGFIPSDGPFKTLQGIGLRLISDDSLRNDISELYDYGYDYYLGVEQNWYGKFIFYMINEVNSKYLDGNNCPVDPEILRSSNDYAYHLNLCKKANYVYVIVIEQTRDNVENLIKQIEIELEM